MATITQLQTHVQQRDDGGIIVPNVRPVGTELSPDPKWRDWRLREQRPALRPTYPLMYPPIAPQIAYRAQLQIDKYTREEEIQNPVFSPRSLDDLAGYSPARLRFRLLAETHQRVHRIVQETRPRKPIREGDFDKLPAFWFEEMSSSLFARLWDFAAATFGHADFSEKLEERDWTGDMLRHLPADFVRCASVVARGDPYRKPKTGPKDYNDHGYEFLFLSKNDRVYLCVAVIAKLLQEQCFDSLLFGARPQERAALELLDRSTDGTADGYARKFARYNPIHEYVRDELFAADFWPEVDRVTAGILSLLLPLINMIGPLCPTAPWPPLLEVHQKLHNIVAEAAYLSNGDKLSRSCFWIDFPQPGQLWDPRQEHVTDISWEASSQAAQARDNHVLEESDEMKEWYADRDAAYQKAGRQTPLDDSQSAARYELQTPRPRSRVRRTAKVQISLFPFLERYFPLQQNVANGSRGNTGDQTTVVQKAQVVYYAGDDSDEMEEWEDYTLQQHLQAWEDIVKPASSSGSFIGSLQLITFLLSVLRWLWWGGCALFLLYLFLPSYASIPGGLASNFRISSVLSSASSRLPGSVSGHTETILTSTSEEVRTIDVDPVATTLAAAEENLERPIQGTSTAAAKKTYSRKSDKTKKATSQKYSSSRGTKMGATVKGAAETDTRESEKLKQTTSQRSNSGKGIIRDAQKKDSTKTITRKRTRAATSTVSSQDKPRTYTREVSEVRTRATTRTDTKTEKKTTTSKNTMKRGSSDEDAAPKEPKTITRKGTRTRTVTSADVTTQHTTDRHARSEYTITSQGKTSTTTLQTAGEEATTAETRSTSTQGSGLNAWFKKPWSRVTEWRASRDDKSLQDDAVQDDAEGMVDEVASEEVTAAKTSSISARGSGLSAMFQMSWNRISNWRGGREEGPVQEDAAQDDAENIVNKGSLDGMDRVLADIRQLSAQLAEFVFDKVDVKADRDNQGRDVVVEQESKAIPGSAHLHGLLEYLGSSESKFRDFMHEYTEKHSSVAGHRALFLIHNLVQQGIQTREDAERAVKASSHPLGFWRDYFLILLARKTQPEGAEDAVESADKNEEMSDTMTASGVAPGGDQTSVTMVSLNDITVEEYIQEVVNPTCGTSEGSWTVSEFFGINYNCTVNNNGEATCFQTVLMPEATATG